MSFARILAGCTAVVALKKGNKLYVANAGDSRGILCRADNTVWALSEDHKPMQVGEWPSLNVRNVPDCIHFICSRLFLSPCNRRQEREHSRIVAAGGYVNKDGRVNGNLNLSRSLGDLKYKQVASVTKEEQMITAEPDITVTTLMPGDKFFMLACDGVWDVLTNQDACDFVRTRLESGMTPLEVVNEVFTHCIADNPRTSGGIGGDNMTCIVVMLKS
jgi:serine/threonine protein phosphatase PrpC